MSRWLRVCKGSPRRDDPKLSAMRSGFVGIAGIAVLAMLAMGAGRSGSVGPIYTDVSAPIDQRVADLLGRMTLAEKAGQLAMIHVGRLKSSSDLSDVLAQAQVGSILSGGGETPSSDSSLAGWARGVDALQRYALAHSRLGIPIVYGSDATHGFTGARGAEIYPQQLGLAATRDPALVQAVAAATARVARAAGVRWIFGPVADVARDLRWGRYYETFGEQPAAAGRLAAASVRGLQGPDPAKPMVAATAKHFLGYSQPRGGVDTAPVQLSSVEIEQVFAPSFAAAIDAGVASVMNQHGWVNGVPTVASKALLTGLLRADLGFRGVTLSDWGDVENLVCSCQGAPAIKREPPVAADYEHAVARALNAGLDVSMVPDQALPFTRAVEAAVRDRLVDQATIDAAVSRVLRLKFELGLFERPYSGTPTGAIRTTADARLARRAADESLTLLRNARGLLPLPRRGRPVLVVGPGATDLRQQYGGWTVGWQGVPAGAPPPPGVTILAGTRAALGRGNVRTIGNWSNAAAVRAAARGARAAIVVVGEEPYAEWLGDSTDAALAPDQASLVRTVERTGVPTVLVLVAGRPLMISDLIRGADAFLMAYLPGSEGGTAVADVLFGRVAARGNLPFTWPAGIRDVPMSLDRRLDGKAARPLYRYGSGLTTRART
jgi:beta-glucosidase